METKFPKFTDKGFPNKWARFFHAGTDWLQAYEIIKKEQKKEDGVWLPYFYAYALAFTIELFVKSIVAHQDASFGSKSFGHRTTDIINAYRSKIEILEKITNDRRLMNLIKNYEDTVDTKFGDTAVSIDGGDEQMVVTCAYEIRSEMCKRTGLR